MQNHQNYSTIAAYAGEQQQYLSSLAAHCSYAITLQTNLHTCNIAASTMQRNIDSVRAALAYLRRRLNRLLTGNGYRRKNTLLPVFIPAIEGGTNSYDRNRTLHVHAVLGNTGHTVTAETCELLQQGIAKIWQATGIGTADVRVEQLRKGTEQRWMSYIGKEAWNRQNIDVIDYSNVQVPAHILDTIGTRTQANTGEHRQAPA